MPTRLPRRRAPAGAGFWIVMGVLVALLLLALAASFLTAGRPKAAEIEDVDVALVFLADVSHSMAPDEIRATREAHALALTSPEFFDTLEHLPIGRIAIAYVEFAGWAIPVVPWRVVNNREAAGEAAAAIRTLSGSSRPATDIEAGMETAARLFQAMPYRATRLVVDVVGDGKGAWSLFDSRQALLDMGATINGLPLLVHDDTPADLGDWYAAHVSGGPGHFTVPVHAIADMPAALRRKLAMEIF